MLIQTRQLYKQLGQFRILDASWYMPAQGVRARDLFVERRLPGAMHIDIDTQFAADPHTLPAHQRTLPHMLPGPDKFSAECGRLGLSRDDRIVLYDQTGLFSSARAWFIFHKLYGHEHVYVLDGGLPQWVQDALPTSTAADALFEPDEHTMHRYGPVARDAREHVVAHLDDVKRFAAGQRGDKHFLIDARARDRFDGLVQEPREGVASGHVPGSINVPFDSLLQMHNNRRFKPRHEIEQAFVDAGLPRDALHDPDTHITTTCGSGVTASVLAYALDQIVGFKGRLSLYDGSWAEYGHKDSGTQIAKKEGLS